MDATDTSRGKSPLIFFLRKPDRKAIENQSQQSTQNSITDAYELAASMHGYRFFSIAVLETSFDDFQGALADAMNTYWAASKGLADCPVFDCVQLTDEIDTTDRLLVIDQSLMKVTQDVLHAISYSRPIWGLALTSKQAVVAIDKFLTTERGDHWIRTRTALSKEVFAFTVGKATSAALRTSIVRNFVQIVSTPHVKNAKELGEAISYYYKQSVDSTPDRNMLTQGAEVTGQSVPEQDVLWFPCSAIARHDLETSVTDERIRVVRTEVYDTVASVTGVQQLQATLEEATQGQASAFSTPWICCFSPSGVDAVGSVLDKYGCRSEHEPSRIRIAAIGPTTAAALVDTGCTVHAIADEPTALSLMEAIRAQQQP
eukprot:m.573126 g.573126  ORF g.573126 m.573126 type:complete len:372 (-) comp22277_c0_seq4:2344-3459(-)